MTEVPQATAREAAREQAIEVMANGVQELLSQSMYRYEDPSPEEMMAAALDALLAATQEEPCATCGETGRRLLPAPSTLTEPCPDCTNGRVPGAPLVLLGPEQVAWIRNNRLANYMKGHDEPDGWLPLFRAPFIEAQREEA